MSLRWIFYSVNIFGGRVRVWGTLCPIIDADVTGSPHQIGMIASFSFVLALATLSFRQLNLNILCATILREPLNCKISIQKVSNQIV